MENPWGSLGDALGTPGALLGDPWGSLGIPWGSLGTPRGQLRNPGDPAEPFGDTLAPFGIHLGIPLGSSGTSWDLLVTPWRSLGDHLEVFLVTLDASWTFFGANLELQGTPRSSQSGSGRPLGGLLGSFWKLRKRIRSDSLQHAKTFKFTVRYCKIRGSKRLNSLKI